MITFTTYALYIIGCTVLAKSLSHIRNAKAGR